MIDDILVTKPLNEEQSAFLARWVEVRDWIEKNLELGEERVAGWISEDV